MAGSAWYAATVQTCYEVGLMTGTGAGFAPDQVLTVGEVAAIAARMNEAITGDSIYLVDSTLPWYASYVDYLEKLGWRCPIPSSRPPARSSSPCLPPWCPRIC